MPQIPWVAVVLATVTGFALGAIWYGPLFGKTWTRALGLSPDQMSRINPGVAYGTTFAWALLTAIVLGAELGQGAGARWGLSCGAG